jgi:exosortase
MTAWKSMRGNGTAWLLALAVIWGWTWWHLSIEWGTNAQYQYGFAIPFLFVYLAVQRWHGVFKENQAGRWSALALAAVWLLFLFGDLLRQHDPIWRLTGGTLMLSATLATVVWLHRCDGWALVGRLSFPLAFAWLALPWPVPVELYVTQNLLHLLTDATVIVLNLFGIAAFQRGNVIELSNGLVGMEAACSGVQSFQASLMAALFLGEFYRLGWLRRLWLVIAGAGVALMMNFGRVLFLALSVHFHGESAVAQYHDRAGTVASILTFSLLLLIAAAMKPRLFSSESEPAAPFARNIRLSGGDGYAMLAAFLCIPLAAWAWFFIATSGHLKTLATPQWTLSPGEPEKNWLVENIPENPREHELLQYSERQGVLMKSPDGEEMRILHFFWKPGKSMPSLAFYHTPEMCMPWFGWTETAAPAPVTLTVHGTPLPCVAYRFQSEGTRQIVYQALCAGGKTSTFMLDPAAMAGRGKRLSMLWRAPLEQVNEELLVYLPVSENRDPDSETRLAVEILNRVLYPSRSTP